MKSRHAAVRSVSSRGLRRPWQALENASQLRSPMASQQLQRFLVTVDETQCSLLYLSQSRIVGGRKTRQQDRGFAMQ